MFQKTIRKLSVSWQEKYLQSMDQLAEDDKQFHDVESMWDVPFESQDGTALAMNLFRPKRASPPSFPVVIMVHGGGFLMGDRRMETGICRHFAQAGFLSSSIEYRVFPEADIRSVVLDLAGGMEEIARIASDYGGDPDRVYLVAESAGVFASLYAVGMTRSDLIAKAFGGRNPGLHIRAMAALSGLFYVRRKDLIGLAMTDNVIPKDSSGAEYARLMNAESDEVVDCLPPMILVSSKGDFLKKDTLRYADCLKKHEKEHRLVYHDQAKHLGHAFASLTPELPESIAADQMIARWFFEY